MKKSQPGKNIRLIATSIFYMQWESKKNPYPSCLIFPNPHSTLSPIGWRKCSVAYVSLCKLMLSQKQRHQTKQEIHNFLHFRKDKNRDSITNYHNPDRSFQVHTHTSHLSDCAPLAISFVSSSSQESSST